jgi:integrase
MKRNRRAGVEDRWTKTVRNPDGTTRSERSASYGEGSRWRARYVDEEGREHAKAFRRKADAQTWLDNIVTAQVTGTYVDPERGKVTFLSFYTEWSAQQVWVSGTKHSMDLAVNSVTFGNMGLADIRPWQIEKWVKVMQDSDLRPTTIATRFANVRNVFRAAVHHRFTPRDVTTGITLPPTRKPSAAMTIPTPQQVGAAILAADDIDPCYAAFIALCAFAGLRRGEASALKVSDVDFMHGEIHVERQVQWTDDGQMEIRGPKRGSERTIYVPDAVVTILSEHVRLYQPGDDADRWLFPGARDNTLPAHAATVARLWRKVRDRVGIDYRLHDLRHFYASGLIAAGCDVVTVQRALGHSMASITLDTYSHLWPNANDRTRKAAAGLVDEALGSPADILRTEGQN